MKPTTRLLIVTGAWAMSVGVAFTVVNLAGLTGRTGPEGGAPPYVRLYDQPSSPAERALNQGDGQAFAALAMDPSLDRPDVFRGGRSEAAYRAQRPLLPWLTWATSGGRATVVPIVLIAWAIIGTVALAVAAGWWLLRCGADPRWGILAVFTPGALVTLDWTGPESLGTALAVAGVILWRHGRLAWSVPVLVLSGLARETLLLVPVVLVVHELCSSGFRRRLLLLAAPAGVYATWVLVVWLRLGAWPSDAAQGRLSYPFAGMLEAAAHWRLADALVLALLAAIVVAACRVDRAEVAAWIGCGYLAVSSLFGAAVWARFEDFARVLLPMVVFSSLAASPLLRSRRAGAGHAR